MIIKMLRPSNVRVPYFVMSVVTYYTQEILFQPAGLSPKGAR